MLGHSAFGECFGDEFGRTGSGESRQAEGIAIVNHRGRILGRHKVERHDVINLKVFNLKQGKSRNLTINLPMKGLFRNFVQN